MDKARIRKFAIPLSEFGKNFTEEELKIIDADVKYYTVVSALREKRKSLGFTQEKLAEISKVPRSTINRIESGSRNARLDTLMAIAQSMGHTIELRLA
jgi:DNA-binding XRE family transcriptional regulator